MRPISLRIQSTGIGWAGGAYITLGLIAAGGGALLVSRLFSPVQSNVVTLKPLQIASRSAGVDRSTGSIDFSDLERRPLFSPGRRVHELLGRPTLVQLTKKSLATSSPPIPTPREECLTLIGTVIGPTRQFAIVKHERSPDLSYLAVGDHLGTLVLQKIEESMIYFRAQNGLLKTLEFPSQQNHCQ